MRIDRTTEIARIPMEEVLGRLPKAGADPQHVGNAEEF
jgi:hypothetical protein